MATLQKIYIGILNSLLFTALSSSIVLSYLSKGLEFYISDINSTIKIKLDRKLYIESDRVHIEIPESSEESEEVKIDVEEIVSIIEIFQSVVEKIYVKDLKVGDFLQGEFFYRNGDISFNGLKNRLYSQTELVEDGAYINIRNLGNSEFGLTSSGILFLRYEDNSTFVKFDASLKGVEAHLFGKIENWDKTSALLTSEKIYSLPVEVPNLKFETLEITKAFTNFSLSKPETALENLKVFGNGKNISYKFDANLEAPTVRDVKFQISDGNLDVETAGVSYGKNRVSVKKLQISSLFSKPYLNAFATGKIDLKNLQNTISYYSNLEELPVAVGTLNLDFNFNMKLYDDFNFSFLAKSKILDSKRVFEKPFISSGVVKFKFPEMVAELENTELYYGSMLHGFGDGKIQIRDGKLDIDFFADKVFIDEKTKLDSEKIDFHIGGYFLNRVEISNLSETDWIFGGVESNISNFKTSYNLKEGKFQFEDKVSVQIPEFGLNAKINGYFLVGEMIGRANLFLDRFLFSEVDIERETLPIYLKNSVIQIPKLAFTGDFGEERYLKFREVSKFRKYLPILRDYPEIFGSVKVDLGDDIKVDSYLRIPDQHLLKDGDDFVEKLHISGTISDEVLKFKGNENIFFSKENDEFYLIFEDYDVNISALSEFVKESEKSSSSKESSDLKLNVILKENSVHLAHQSKFVSKSGFVQVLGDRVLVNISPEDRGKIEVEALGGKYVVKALNLDKYPIWNASGFQGVEGGRYNLYLEGEGADFKALIQFSRLKIRDMELVNNVLAFINTVPALLTFSRPGFNSDGLRIEVGFGDIEKRGDKIIFHELKILGESVDISVQGNIDIAKSKLDLKVDIAIVKYLDKFVDNIPIANYVILGEDGSLATRIIISGDMSDPSISTELHEEILSAPIKFGRRFLNLPNKLLSLLKEFNLPQKKSQKEVQDLINKIK